MKKIFAFLAFAITLTGCAVVTKIDNPMMKVYKTTTGDVIRRNDNGEIIEVWKDALIDRQEEVLDSLTAEANKDNFNTSFLKGGGIRFHDNGGYFHYLHGGLISVDNININVEMYNLAELAKQHEEIAKKREEIAEKNKKIKEKEKQDSLLIKEYKDLQVKYIATRDKKPATAKFDQNFLSKKIARVEIEMKKAGIDYFEHMDNNLLSGNNEDALSEIHLLVAQLKSLDEVAKTLTDAKKIKENKHEHYDASQKLYTKYGINYKKL